LPPFFPSILAACEMAVGFLDFIFSPFLYNKRLLFVKWQSCITQDEPEAGVCF
jgi:hypothetical protein